MYKVGAIETKVVGKDGDRQMTLSQQITFDALAELGWTTSAIIENIQRTVCGSHEHLFCAQCEPELFEEQDDEC